MKIRRLRCKTYISTLFFISAAPLYAEVPVWVFTPLTATTVVIAENGTANVQYQVTNQSPKSHALQMEPIRGVTQLTGTPGLCNTIFELPTQGSSCTLSLQINANQLVGPILNGPVVCQRNSLQCYRPAAKNILHITTASQPASLQIGQTYGGGVVACLGGGLNNLIAASTDQSTGANWAPAFGLIPGTNSATDGAANTVALAANTPSSSSGNICSDYAVDSQGNACTPGNPGCFDDWFLPARNQLNCLSQNQAAIGNFAADGYWSSTQNIGDAQNAFMQFFPSNPPQLYSKPAQRHVRCVRQLQQ